MSTLTWNSSNPAAIVSNALDNFELLATYDLYGAQTDTTFGLESPDHSRALVFTGTGFGAYVGNHPTTGEITGYSEVDVAGGGAVNYTVTDASLTVSQFDTFIAANDAHAVAFHVFYGEDSLTGGPNADTLVTYGSSSVIYGGGGDDSIYDSLSGTLYGGQGNDTYYLGGPGGSLVRELPGEGVDTIVVNYDWGFGLPDNVENLTITGSAVFAYGNSLSNVITGDALPNKIYGIAGAGPDTLIGGDGNDWYLVSNPADVIIETPTGGTGDFVTTEISYVLPDNVEQLWLQGAAAINGTGNAGDNGLVGNDADNTLDGQGGNDWLLGYGGNDTLIGGPGNDWLDGGIGADTMIGGTGNDIYFVDNPGDVIIENPGEGTDAVVSTISYTLPANVEQLWFTANNADINGTGNNGDNGIEGNNGANTLDGQGGNDWLVGLGGNDVLIGGAGNDWLDGGTGADTMSGGTGDDVYIVDNAGDVIIENPGEGNDSVATSVSYVLPANVENLYLSQTQANINGVGNALNNIISGNDGNNVLLGMAGNDTIKPFDGNDIMTGGTGDDTFVFGPHIVGAIGEVMGNDLITDFSVSGPNGTDTLDFTGVAAAGITWTLYELGPDAVFAFSDGSRLTLQGVDMATLLHPSADFYL